GHRRRLATVEGVLNGGTPATGLNINEIRHVAGGDAQPERVPSDRRAVEELRVRPHRSDGRHLVDGHLRWWRYAQRGQKRDSRVVSASPVRCGFTAGGEEIQAGVAALRGGEAQGEVTISAAFSPGELRGRA